MYIPPFWCGVIATVLVEVVVVIGVAIWFGTQDNGQKGGSK